MNIECANENRDERVVEVVETVLGEQTVFYAIRDVFLGYWRSTQPLEEFDAWTKDRRRRAEFDTRREAERELAWIWISREETDEDDASLPAECESLLAEVA